jgi:hypothetical protein
VGETNSEVRSFSGSPFNIVATTVAFSYPPDSKNFRLLSGNNSNFLLFIVIDYFQNSFQSSCNRVIESVLLQASRRKEGDA